MHVSREPLPHLAVADQFRTIVEAVQAVGPGDNVVIHHGIYREKVTIDQSGTAAQPISFEAAPGAEVIITGADHILDWTPEKGTSGAFGTAWQHRFIGWNPKSHAHPDDDFHRLIGRAEQVFVDQSALHQVLRKEELGRGRFFIDLENHRLLISPADNRPLGPKANPDITVEASARDAVWVCNGDNIRVRGLRFRRAANQAQAGAAQFKGRDAVVEDCVFEQMNSVGAAFLGTDQVVRRCAFQDNGQLGFAAMRAHRLRMTDCTIRNNNTKGFNRGWEAGGTKIVLSRGVVIEHSSFLENRGIGVWFDIGNEDCVVRNCLIARNEDAGIFYEISYRLRAHDNVIIGNGLSSNAPAWGAWAGISLSSSPGCEIERNLLVGNREGFSFREALRKTPRIEAAPDAPEESVWNHDELIRGNVIAHNQEAQVRGWFDVDDERHWPAAMQRKRVVETKPVPDAAGAPPAETTGAPANLSLEKLNLTLSENVYATIGTQRLFVWGVSWKRNQSYRMLREVQQELGLEAGGLVEAIPLANYHQRDFRLSRDVPPFVQQRYPRGSVPGVQLGLLE